MLQPAVRPQTVKGKLAGNRGLACNVKSAEALRATGA
jgi:hypothetical protein